MCRSDYFDRKIMKFRITTTELKNALADVQGVIAKKTTIPVLANVLIESEADSNRIRFTGTDLDTTLTVITNAEIEQHGSMCINGRKLADLAKLLNGDVVEFTLEVNDWATVKCGRGKYKVAGVKREQFPETPKPPTELFELSGKTFAEMLKRTGFAITAEQSRFTLAGAKFILNGGTSQMVATDGHRLTYSERTDGAAESAADVLIPKAALTEMAKLFADDDVIRFGVDANHVYAESDTESVHARLLTGNFPNWEMVMPKTLNGSFTANVEELRNAIRRVSLMGDERSRSVRITVRTGELEIAAKSAEEGDGVEIVPAEVEIAEEITFGFNWHYLLEYLSTLDSDTKVTCSFTTPNAQTLWTDSASGDADKCVVMPLRI